MSRVRIPAMTLASAVAVTAAITCCGCMAVAQTPAPCCGAEARGGRRPGEVRGQ
jgi:hypothetical protein